MTPERALEIAVSVAQNAAPAKTKAQLHAAAEARRAEAQERRTDRARQLEANIAAAAQNAARVAADRQLEARQNY